ncbi:MAG: hypothetical protein LBR78_01550 [Holosporales bacterium]|nr:hypothetical protein [Holosporales bacterium]
MAANEGLSSELKHGPETHRGRPHFCCWSNGIKLIVWGCDSTKNYGGYDEIYNGELPSEQAGNPVVDFCAAGYNGASLDTLDQLKQKLQPAAQQEQVEEGHNGKSFLSFPNEYLSALGPPSPGRAPYGYGGLY